MNLTKPRLDQFKITGSTVGDVYFPQTKLLLPFDGSNGATTTSDLSNSNRTVTFYGTAQLSTAQSKFGGSSLLLDGNSDYLTVPHVSADIVTELTLETWFKTSSSAYQTLIGNYAGSAGTFIQLNTGGTAGTIGAGVHGNTQITSSSGGYADGNWHHVALTRNASNLITLWVDGVSKATGTDSSAMLANSFYIGRLNSASLPRYFDGYLDDVRWTPSVCRYTSNFTPPTTAHLTSAGDVNKQIIVNSAADGVAIGTGGINQARIVKAWISFNGSGTVAVRDSYNVSSVTDTGTGNFTLNFSSAMTDTNYCAVGMSDANNGENITVQDSILTTTTLGIVTIASNGVAVADSTMNNVAIFGN